jgi:hypothetical protein
MDASNRPRRPAPRRSRRRPDCSPPTSRRRAVAIGPACCPGPAEPSVSGSLKVTIQVIPLPDPESNPLRARQLAVIVDLLRRAASEAAERDASPRKRAQA